MDPTITKGLNDKFYEKRKAAALELERLVRECHQQGDTHRINQIVDQLVDLFSSTSNALHVRNGGLIGLAATGIALGVEIAPYMEKFIEPILICFTDSESRIRYFACESMYNIAKVSKGEILVYFNPIFDALSKLAADSELSVKNGAELLDRLLKDIVAESASVYVPQFPQTEKVRLRTEEAFGLGILVPRPDDGSGRHDLPSTKKAFSLAHFMPLLADRIHVRSPFTRSYLVSWISVLDSVPDLELVAYLPEFLDGLLQYLSDPTTDVKVATENLLADFLREICEIAALRNSKEAKSKATKEIEQAEAERKASLAKEKLSELTMESVEKGAFMNAADSSSLNGGELTLRDSPVQETPGDRDIGAWVPGQGVAVDYGAIVEILISQLDGEHDEIQQSTALRWLSEFLNFAQDVMVPFTPRLIPAILPNLAHHVQEIQTAAIQTNSSLFQVIQNLPSPPSTNQPASTSQPSLQPVSSASSLRTVPISSSSPVTTSPAVTRGAKDAVQAETPTPEGVLTLQTSRRRSTAVPTPQEASLPAFSSQEPMGPPLPPSRPHTPSPSPSLNVSMAGALPATQPSPSMVTLADDVDPFNYQETVNMLTIQFLSEHEDTRVAALRWLIMLHQKAPKKILAMDDGTFPALLKTLSDTSEEVIKHDLQLLAQISTSSEERYFKAFMMNLLDLFSTDRRLLETRGSLIIRQLCVSLNAERIYKTLAEILEKEEDLEFASMMIQKLNIILITSPELLDFRRRLKTLDTRQDGQVLFTTLYRSWCHNPVAVFSLCLLAQAYEHATNLLRIFADLEITVQLLVQIDKLVQLIESPVFTYLRLQLLEPEQHPFLIKCLYGLLMLLPQSSAFVSLRNRLNSASAMGSVHIGSRPSVSVASSRSKLGREDIKWQELLSHFRAVQMKHEKARRGGRADPGPLLAYSGDKSGAGPSGSNGPIRPIARRKVTGESIPSVRQGTALSPLNPRARANGNGLLASAVGNSQAGPSRSISPTLQNNKRRALSLNRK